MLSRRKLFRVGGGLLIGAFGIKAVENVHAEGIKLPPARFQIVGDDGPELITYPYGRSPLVDLRERYIYTEWINAFDGVLDGLSFVWEDGFDHTFYIDPLPKTHDALDFLFKGYKEVSRGTHFTHYPSYLYHTVSGQEYANMGGEKVLRIHLINKLEPFVNAFYEYTEFDYRVKDGYFVHTT